MLTSLKHKFNKGPTRKENVRALIHRPRITKPYPAKADRNIIKKSKIAIKVRQPQGNNIIAEKEENNP
jgi:hypothetical protein